ncbi:glycosyltransferase [Kaistella rhinocerotis]|uniref:glycosyltransferase n=1 Tax=Kaistella rhinocerotis TaxID=3026437 RepID=UPI0025538885|nr:glycosyltransferase [Kaistella sp. Ran72]
MKKQSILFLQPTFDSNGPRNIRTANLLRYLKDDFKITVLCFEVKDEYRQIEGVEVIRLPMNWVNKFFLFKDSIGYKPMKIMLLFNKAISLLIRKLLVIDGFILEKSKIINVLANRDFDFVVASMKPESMGEIALKLKRKGTNVDKVIFDIGDPLSNNSANNLNKLSELIYKFIESKMLKKADAIIVTNSYTKKYYTDEFSINEQRIHIIPQGVDLNLIQDDESPCYKEETSMIYAGGFYPRLRDSAQFVKAVNHLDRERLTIKFYGSSDLNFEVTNTKIIQKGKVGQDFLFKEFAKANVILYFDNAYGIQTSGKIFEILALNKPILFLYSNEESPVYMEHKSNKSILFVKNDFREICECLSNIESLLERIPSSLNDAEQYSWSSRAEVLKKVIYQIS